MSLLLTYSNSIWNDGSVGKLYVVNNVVCTLSVCITYSDNQN